MRVLFRPGEPTDLRARLDETLATGETVRDGGEIRVGAGELADADALRAAAACAARTLRRTGGTIAWAVDDALPISVEEQVRALVEGTAYGAYDPGLFKRGYDEHPQVDLVLEASDDLRDLAERQATVMRHVDGARDLSNRPPNDLTPVALAEHA